MTRVYFVRHAEPNYANHDDVARELTDKGLQDRLLVTDFFKDKNISAVASSPYIRAIDTVKHFADSVKLNIEIIDDFRERKIGGSWIENFTEFSQKQWSDFDYKLTEGESLGEVQKRNIHALNNLVAAHSGQNIVVGSHGTALSTIINYYDKTFNYDGFLSIKDKMPWIAEFVFDGEGNCIEINKYDVLEY